MQEGGADERSERSRWTLAELGRLLAAAEGYRVLESDGTHVGWLDHVRYERHADHPDEIVVRSRSRRPRRPRAQSARESNSRPSLLFFSVQEGGADERSERSRWTLAELGRLLAAAEGYRVLESDGTHVGWLDHVRYERHADHPDEIVVRSRSRSRSRSRLARRRRALPFSAVEEVRPRDRTIVLRGARNA